jgi:hypothetical protein
MCKHCPMMSSMERTHKYVCNCGHSHDDHVFSAGCTVYECKCDRYSQTQQVRPGQHPKMPVALEIHNV